MSSLFGIGGNGASSSFYDETIDQSLRFDDGNSKLVRVPSSSGNRKKWTTSFWVKRSQKGESQYLWTSGAHSGNNGIAAIYFNTDDKIHTYFDTTGANPYGSVNSRVYRDTSSWYNIVWAVDAANTVQRIWVNGVEESLSSSLNPPNYAYGMNQAGINQTFGIAGWGGSPNLDGYLANIVHLDGQYLDQSYFGETKKGVWVPKEITGLTFGTNGFHLTFANSSDIGEDISGNNNDFTPTGLTSDDIVPDTPTNNFSTWNPLFRGGEKSSSIYANSTLTNGALKVSVPTNSYMGNTFRPVSGKWYMEMRVTTIGHSNKEIDWGWIQATEYSSNTGHSGQANKWGIFAFQTHIRIYDETSQLGSNISVSLAVGDILQLAWDIDNNKGWVGINNTWYRTDASDGNPSAGTNQTFTFTDDEAQNLQCYIANGTSTDVHVANFGQDGSFAGGLTGGNIGTASDANGVGAFKYAPPTGFLALCSANLPDTNLSPNQLEQATDYFNVALKNMSTNSEESIAVGFQPDWVWGKSRNSAYAWQVYDSNRGTGKYLEFDDGTETTNANSLKSFDANGITVGSGATFAPYSNGNNVAFWNWKVNGGTTTTDNNGSLTSTVQTNSKVGISIATFTVPTQANFSFGHGLGSVPEMFWWKSRTTVQNWIVYHPAKTTSVPGSPGLYLNNSLAGFATGGSWITELSSTRIAITDGKVSSGSNRDDVVYSFKSVEGFSKIGSYTGNGSTDGTFVYTGFRPAFVLGKSITSSGDNWFVFDNKRDVDNVVGADLNPDSTATEATSTYMDFVSNGFKLRSTSGLVNDATTFVYMAFAEQPFKFSNAR